MLHCYLIPLMLLFQDLCSYIHYSQFTYVCILWLFFFFVALYQITFFFKCLLSYSIIILFFCFLLRIFLNTANRHFLFCYSLTHQPTKHADAFNPLRKLKENRNAIWSLAPFLRLCFVYIHFFSRALINPKHANACMRCIFLILRTPRYTLYIAL